MGFKLLNWKALFFGRASNPNALVVPTGLITTLLGFELYVILYAFFVLFRPDPGEVIVEPNVERVDVLNCYVILTCRPRAYSFTRAGFDVKTENGTLVVDGRNTLRCNVELCLDRANTPGFETNDISFFLTDSVLFVQDANKPDPANDFIVSNITHNLIVRDSVEAGNTFSVNKVHFGFGEYRDLIVNISKGVVNFNNIVAENVDVNVGYGTVILSNDFEDRPFQLSATVQDNNYCVAQAVMTNGTFSAGTCIAVNTTYGTGNASTVLTRSLCPVFASWAADSNTSFVQFNRSDFAVTATALYVNNGRHYRNPEEFATNETARVPGSGMLAFPEMDPDVQELLNQTQTWKTLSTIDDYVQAVEVVTPGLGMIYLHSSQRILFEIGPEWIAFYSAFALRPNYRRLYTMLSHYRCNAIIAEPFTKAGSLTNIILDTPAQYDQYSDMDMRFLLERFFSRRDMYEIAEKIYEYADELLAVVAFTAPEFEWTDPNDLLGNRWSYYLLQRRSDTSQVEVVKLQDSKVGLAISVISGLTALITALFVLWLLFIFRNEIMQSFLLIPERELLRASVDHKEPCPYHYFFGVLTLSSWVAFRINRYVAQDILSALQQPMLLRFLNFYYGSTKNMKDEDRATSSKMTKSTTVSLIMGQFDNWSMLRYADTSDVTREASLEGFEEFGGRILVDEKYVVGGLAKKSHVKASAQFSLEYTALQNFYDVTANPTDEVLLDNIYFRAVMENGKITEEDVVKKLRQWNLNVRTDDVETVVGIRPHSFTKECMLSEEEMTRLVALFEYNFSSFPSYGLIEWNTSGPKNKWRRRFTRAFWMFLESILVTIATFLPLVFGYLIAMPLDIEHARYSTSTSILRVRELQYAATDVAAPRPQNPVSTTIFAAGLAYTVLALFEPFLVLATFRTVATFHQVQSYKWLRPTTWLLGLRFFCTAVMIFINFCLFLFTMWYSFTVMIWWLLGAIIAPTRMLVYASSVFTFLYVLYSTYSNLDKMRRAAIQRLEERILAEILKVIRQSPAKSVFDSVSDTLNSASGRKNKLMPIAAEEQKVEVTTGMLLDVMSDDAEKRDAALEQLSVALGVPVVILKMVMALFSRRPRDIKAAVMEVFELMKVPEVFSPLAIQLANAALKLPVTATDLTHAFYPLIIATSAQGSRQLKEHGEDGAADAMSEKNVHDQLMAHDEIIVSIVNAMLQKTVDEKTFAKMVLQLVASQLSKALNINPNLLSEVVLLGFAVYEEKKKDSLIETGELLRILKPMLPDDPPELRAVVQMGIEVLNLAAGEPHNVKASAITLLESTKLHQTPFMKVLAPLFDPAGGKKQKQQALLAAMEAADDPEAAAAGAKKGLVPALLRKAKRTETAKDAKGVVKQTAAQAVSAARKETMDKIISEAAGMAIQILEVKFSVSPDQQSTLMLLLRLIDGNPQHMAQVNPELLPTAASYSVTHVEAVGLLGKHIESVKAEQSLRYHVYHELVKKKHEKDAMEPTTAFTWSRRELIDELRMVNGPTFASTHESLKDTVEKVQAEFRDLREKQATFDSDHAPLTLQTFIADQWIALVTLVTFGRDLPEPLCNYEFLEAVAGVPSDALRMFRSGLRMVMGFTSRLLDEVSELPITRAELRATLFNVLKQGDKTDEEMAAAMREAFKKAIDTACEDEHVLNALKSMDMTKESLGDVFDELEMILTSVQEMTTFLFKEQKLGMKFNFNLTNMLVRFLELQIKNNDQDIEDQLEALQAAASQNKLTKLKAMSKKAAAKAAGAVGKKAAKKAGVDPAAAAQAEDAKVALKQGRLPASIVMELMMVLNELKAGGIPEHPSEVVGSVKNIAGILVNNEAPLVTDSHMVTFVEKLDVDTTLILLDDLIDFYCNPESRNLDLGALASIFDVDARTIAMLVRPELACRADRALAPLPLFVRALQGNRVESLLESQSIDTFLTPFLEMLGEAEKAADHVKQLKYFTQIGWSSSEKGAEGEGDGKSKGAARKDAKNKKKKGEDKGAAAAKKGEAVDPASLVDFGSFAGSPEQIKLGKKMHMKALIDKFLTKMRNRLKHREVALVPSISVYKTREIALKAAEEMNQRKDELKELSEEKLAKEIDTARMTHKLDRFDEDFLTEVYLHFVPLRHAWVSLMNRARKMYEVPGTTAAAMTRSEKNVFDESQKQEPPMPGQVPDDSAAAATADGGAQKTPRQMRPKTAATPAADKAHRAARAMLQKAEAELITLMDMFLPRTLELLKEELKKDETKNLVRGTDFPGYATKTMWCLKKIIHDGLNAPMLGPLLFSKKVTMEKGRALEFLAQRKAAQAAADMEKSKRKKGGHASSFDDDSDDEKKDDGSVDEDKAAVKGKAEKTVESEVEKRKKMYDMDVVENASSGGLKDEEVMTDIFSAFGELSPFALLAPDVPRWIRETFAILYGVPDWYPVGPRPLFAIVSILVRQRRVHSQVLSLVASVMPIKTRKLCMELCELARGNKAHPLTSLSTLTNVPPAKLREIRDFMFPEEKISADDMLKYDPADGRVVVVEQQVNYLVLFQALARNDFVRLLRYISIMPEDLRNNFASLMYSVMDSDWEIVKNAMRVMFPHVATDEGKVEVAMKAATSAFPTLLRLVDTYGMKYEPNARRKMRKAASTAIKAEIQRKDATREVIAEQEAKIKELDNEKIHLDEISKQEVERTQEEMRHTINELEQRIVTIDTVVKKLAEVARKQTAKSKEQQKGLAQRQSSVVVPAEDAVSQRMVANAMMGMAATSGDRDTGAVATFSSLAQNMRLMTGALYLVRSDFDNAQKEFLAFAEEDRKQQAVVRVGVLVARLIVEDGAVNDPDACVKALESLLYIAPELFQSVIHPTLLRSMLASWENDYFWEAEHDSEDDVDPNDSGGEDDPIAKVHEHLKSQSMAVDDPSATPDKAFSDKGGDDEEDEGDDALDGDATPPPPNDDDDDDDSGDAAAANGTGDSDHDDDDDSDAPSAGKPPSDSEEEDAWGGDDDDDDDEDDSWGDGWDDDDDDDDDEDEDSWAMDSDDDDDDDDDGWDEDDEDEPTEKELLDIPMTDDGKIDYDKLEEHGDKLMQSRRYGRLCDVLCYIVPTIARLMPLMLHNGPDLSALLARLADDESDDGASATDFGALAAVDAAGGDADRESRHIQFLIEHMFTDVFPNVLQLLIPRLDHFENIIWEGVYPFMEAASEALIQIGTKNPKLPKVIDIVIRLLIAGIDLREAAHNNLEELGKQIEEIEKKKEEAEQGLTGDDENLKGGERTRKIMSALSKDQRKIAAVVEDTRGLGEVIRRAKQWTPEHLEQVRKYLEKAQAANQLIKEAYNQGSVGPDLALALLAHCIPGAPASQDEAEADVDTAKAQAQLVVQSEVQKSATKSLSAQDHEKITLMVQLTQGDFDAVPEILRHAGVEVSEAQLNQFNSVINTMNTIRAMSQRKVSELSPSDLLEMIAHQIFQEIDENNSGSLTLDEFMTALTRMHLNLTEHEAKLWFDELDADGSGSISETEFIGAIKKIRNKFLDKMLAKLRLSKENIYVALIWTAIILMMLIAFLIMGVYGFSDGSQFTAVITAGMPMIGSVVSTVQDPSALTMLFSKIDTFCEMFFAMLEKAAGETQNAVAF